nr:alkaline phosphatase family protein [Cryobacterium sp. MLB-32]
MRRRKFVLIGIDGLIIDRALKSTAAPHLSDFVNQGLYAPMTMEVPTISGPGWSSILTGATHSEHSVFDNSFHGHTLGRNADLLSRAYFADQSVTTYAASGWPPLVDPVSVGPVISNRVEQQNAGVHKIIVRDGETYGYRRADTEVADISRLYLNQGGPDASFVYLARSMRRGTSMAAHPTNISMRSDASTSTWVRCSTRSQRERSGRAKTGSSASQPTTATSMRAGTEAPKTWWLPPSSRSPAAPGTMMCGPVTVSPCVR